jgi:hypothetical protein
VDGRKGQKKKKKKKKKKNTTGEKGGLESSFQMEAYCSNVRMLSGTQQLLWPVQLDFSQVG